MPQHGPPGDPHGTRQKRQRPAAGGGQSFTDRLGLTNTPYGTGNPLGTILEALSPAISYLAPYASQGLSNINQGVAPVRSYLQGPFANFYGGTVPGAAQSYGQAFGDFYGGVVPQALNPYQAVLNAFDQVQTAFGPIGQAAQSAVGAVRQNPRRSILGERADLDVQNFIEDRVQAPAQRLATAFGDITLAPFVQGTADILGSVLPRGLQAPTMREFQKREAPPSAPRERVPPRIPSPRRRFPPRRQGVL